MTTLFDFAWTEESPCIYRNRVTGEELCLGADPECDDVPDDHDWQDWAPVEAQVWYAHCSQGRTHTSRQLLEAYLSSGAEVEGCYCTQSDWAVEYRMVDEIKGRVWVMVPDAYEAEFMGRKDVLKLLGLDKTPKPWCKPERDAS